MIQAVQIYSDNEPLWTAIITLLERVQICPQGRGLIKSPDVVRALRTCRGFFRSSPLYERAKQLMNTSPSSPSLPLSSASASKTVNLEMAIGDEEDDDDNGESHSLLMPIAPIQSVPSMTVHRRGSTDDAVQVMSTIRIIPSPWVWAHVEEAMGVKFISCLLRGLVEKKADAWTGKILRILAIVFDKGKAYLG